MASMEFIRKHEKSAAILAVLGALEIKGYVQNLTANPPKDTCATPFNYTESHGDSATSTWLETYPGWLTTGINISGELPPHAFGVQVSYTSPNGKPHVSHVVPTSGQHYNVKMAIGSKASEFGVRAILPAGSTDCDTPPNAAFQHEDRRDFTFDGGNLPFPSPVNVVPQALLTNW